MVALGSLGVSSLVGLQNLTGFPFKREIPLTEESIVKQEGGAFRFSVKRLDVAFPERLAEEAEVLDDGKRLRRRDFRSEVSSEPQGGYAWTGASLWVAPRSDEPQNLAVRIPVFIGRNALLIVFGFTLFALAGVIVSKTERKIWGRWISRTARSMRNRGSRAGGKAARQFAAKRIPFDLLAYVLLGLIGGTLYFPLVDRISQSYDGFLMSYLLETGDLLPYNVDEVKEPGRPFVGLGWHISLWLGGGSVSGYYIFQFTCLVFSSLLVYAVVRVLIPRQPVWALVAGGLKLVWIGNFEIFDNSGLPIYFVETLFWLAVLLFVRRCVRPERLSRDWVAFVGIAICLVPVVGTYQTAWPVVLLVPLSLLGLGVMVWEDRRTWRLFFIWYLSAIPMMAWCASLSVSYADKKYPGSSEIFHRVAAGAWAATGESLLFPFTPAPHLVLELNPFAVLGVIGFAVLLVWFGMGSFPAMRTTTRRQSVFAVLILLSISLAVVIGSLLPPAILYPPNFGTRLIHWAAIGTIILLVTVLACLFRWKAPVGGIVSLAMAFVLFATTFCRAHSVGNFLADSSLGNRRFWEDVVIEIPKVKEGTVILMDGPPLGLSVTDAFGTWVFRAMAETDDTFLYVESTPEFDPDSRTYELASVVSLDPENVLGERMGDNPYFRYSVFPIVLEEPEVFLVPADRVVWVEWDIESLRLSVIPERSEMNRVIQDGRSTFGEMLFPPATAEENRQRVSDRQSR